MWTPDGPTATVDARQGWTVDGPDPAGVETKHGWWVVPQATARDDAAADDLATLRARLAARISGASGDSLYMGTDPTQDFELRIPIRDNSGAQGFATVRARETGRDDAVSADLARLGLIGLDSGAAGDLATAKLAAPARDSAGLGGLVAVRPRQTGPAAASADGTALAGWSAVAPATTAITASGTYKIPVSSRYLDIIVLGGGGGGREGDGGVNRTGNGGKAGTWSAVTLERGVDIPWTAITLTVTVGAGGAAGAKGAGNVNGNTANQGGATSVSLASTTLASAVGGVGGSGTDGNPGESPGTYSFVGQNYTGGASAPSGGSRTVGNPPGGGGGGGAGGIFNGQTAGMAGARGQAWIRARQT